MALEDIHVLDLTIARAGPTAVRQLADWGASVIRVEAPSTGDDFTGDPTNSDYLNLHRNKRALQLDLKQAEGREIFHRLAERADVMVENFRPPVKRKLGVDYETISAINPRLVYGSVSGFGQDGPYAEKGAVDQIVQGMGGLMSITGLPGQGPVRVGVAIADLAAGHQLAIGILVALHERRTSGLGQWVHVSLLESMISFLDFQATRWTIDGEIPWQVGNDHPTAFPMGAFRTADGHINIAASSNRLWARLCDVLDAPELMADPDFATADLRSKNRATLNDRIEAILVTRPTEEWWKLLDEVGIPSGPINTVDKVFEDPQAKHLGMAVTVEHAVRGPVAILRQPVNMSRTPPSVRTASPMPGQHRDEILGELGFTEAEIGGLIERGVV
jgi:crotonobetainyl-CoA:carnitine CoA-transferase CaiB-like acyl-CoA transferase